MAMFVQELLWMEMRILAYLNDILVCPDIPGVVATKGDCADARDKIDAVLAQLGLNLHPDKGKWVGLQHVVHLEVQVESCSIAFRVVEHTLCKVEKLATSLLRQVRMGRRRVCLTALAHFCGVSVSLSFSMPRDRFYTRSIYWDMSTARAADHRGRCRLSHQFVKDLRICRELSKEEVPGRPIEPVPPDSARHTDAADVGYGRTLNLEDKCPGVDGPWHAQGAWAWYDRVRTIT